MGERLYAEGRGSPDSGAATSDQAGKGTAGTQHLLGALYQPAIQQGPPVPTSATLPWPRSFANPPAASGCRKVPGDNPRLRNRLEGQGGRWSPASGQTSGLGTGATKGFDIFSCPRLGLGVLPSLSLPAWSSSSPDLVLGLKVNPSPAALSQHPGPSAGSACPPAAPGYLCFI